MRDLLIKLGSGTKNVFIESFPSLFLGVLLLHLSKSIFLTCFFFSRRLSWLAAEQAVYEYMNIHILLFPHTCLHSWCLQHSNDNLQLQLSVFHMKLEDVHNHEAWTTAQDTLWVLHLPFVCLRNSFQVYSPNKFIYQCFAVLAKLSWSMILNISNIDLVLVSLNNSILKNSGFHFHRKAEM